MSEVEHLVLRVEAGNAIEDDDVARLTIAVPEEGYGGEVLFGGDRFDEGSTALYYMCSKVFEGCGIVCGQGFLEIGDGWAVVWAGGCVGGFLGWGGGRCEDYEQD
jgi:hypothetical protein